MVDDSVEVSDYRALRNCKNQFNPSENDLLRNFISLRAAVAFQTAFSSEVNRNSPQQRLGSA